MDVLERATHEIGIFDKPSKETCLKMCEEITRLRQLVFEAEVPNPMDPYTRIVFFFDEDQTAGSFLREDGDGGFTGAIYRMAREIDRLRQLLSEADNREAEARAKALEEAALRVDAKANGYQVEARDVRRSERDRRFCASIADRLCGAAADIRALQSEER